MKKITTTLNKHRSIIVWIILITVPFIFGLIMSYALFRQSLGMGDSSTFLSFARNIVNGEAIYGDFIHFRTPAAYFFKAFFVWLFGDSVGIINLSQAIESYVLYSSLIMLATAVLYNFKKPAMGFVILPFVIFMPGLTQLRSVLALLSIIFYAKTINNKSNKFLLILSGLFAGLSFCFGQEMGILTVALIGLSEMVICFNKVDHKLFFNRITKLFIGLIIGILPLLVYVIVFSDVFNFLYYVFYYALILQPSGMDLPFPRFCYDNIIYYLPFVIYGLCFFIEYCNKKKNIISSLVLSFAVMRLITLCGRSDMPHLLFSISELFIIVPYIILQVKYGDYSLSRIKSFIGYGLSFTLLTLIAIFYKSLILLLVAFLIIVALGLKKDTVNNVNGVYNRTKAIVLSIIVSLFILFTYLLAPHFLGTAKAVYNGLKTRSANLISGAHVDGDLRNEIEDVTAKVSQLKPQTIFSFPIQAYYYGLAPKHATRFMTFEPQTTLLEQDQTIDDLKKSKPDVVIFDPAQAADLSNSVWKISNYIMSNYSIKYQVNHKHILWIMIPNKIDMPNVNYLIFNLYIIKSNNSHSYSVQSAEKGMRNAIAQISDTKISFNIKSPGVLKISTVNELGKNECGYIEEVYDKRDTIYHKVCTKDGLVEIKIKNSAVLHFVNKNKDVLIWNNPKLEY